MTEDVHRPEDCAHANSGLLSVVESPCYATALYPYAEIDLASADRL